MIFQVDVKILHIALNFHQSSTDKTNGQHLPESTNALQNEVLSFFIQWEASTHLLFPNELTVEKFFANPWLLRDKVIDRWTMQKTVSSDFFNAEFTCCRIILIIGDTVYYYESSQKVTKSTFIFWNCVFWTCCCMKKFLLGWFSTLLNAAWQTVFLFGPSFQLRLDSIDRYWELLNDGTTSLRTELFHTSSITRANPTPTTSIIGQFCRHNYLLQSLQH